MAGRAVPALSLDVTTVHLVERTVVVAGLVAMTLTADVVQVTTQVRPNVALDNARQGPRAVTQRTQVHLQRTAALRCVAGTAVQRITPRLDAVVDGLVGVHRNAGGI